MIIEEEIIKIQNQERDLQFDFFNSEVALELGLDLVESAREIGGMVTIDICLNKKQLFHFAFDGTTPINEGWIRRKNNLVNVCYISSYLAKLLLMKSGKTIEEYFNLDGDDYVAAGGSFPINIRGIGVVGTITVSGLSSIEDHALVVKALENYFYNN